MLVSESSAMHQLRRRSAQKPQLDWIADRMPALLRIPYRSEGFVGGNVGGTSARGMCCNFVVEPKGGSMIGNSVRRREQTENEAVH
jgi:hypothetical protein